MKRDRYRFQFNLFGILFGVLGLALSVAAVYEFVGFRPHGLGHFYEFAPVGILLLLSGIAACVHRNDKNDN
jgi:F0F1-type ATP synthase membrane subunit a